jgi:hypothetical protein
LTATLYWGAIGPETEYTVIPILAAAFLALIALLGGMLFGFAAGRSFGFQSDIGEALVADAICTCFRRPHVLLNNVTLPTQEGTTQIDHVLVADTGIFVIETKRYSGWIFGHPNDPQWTQVIYRKKSRFQNPNRQNYGHVKALQALFALPPDAFFPLVVFTGDAEFKTDLGPAVLKLPDLIAHLSAERPVLFDERKMAYVVGRIEMTRLRRSVETDEYHLNSVRQRIGPFTT